LLNQTLNIVSQNTENLVFLDTEGKRILREIAILNYEGKVIYNAFVKGHYNNKNIKTNLKSLEIIIEDIKEILRNKTIICHQSNHDRDILKNSFYQCNVPFFNHNFICTIDLTKKKYIDYPNYSLSYVAKQLNLKVDGQYFKDNFAHSAVYDAKFTHKLYLHLTKNMINLDRNLQELENTINTKNYTNPFSSSKVDDPFQIHPDYEVVYQSEFKNLQRILAEIKTDKNSQSRGAVIIGEAGTGKTHLIMRVAQKLLEKNRLLFIRQPNNANSVLYHTYSRILESFFQLVPQSKNTQLEYLIAHSFTKILSSYDNAKKSEQGKKLIEELEKDCLNLFRILGAEGTEKYRNNWEFIERHILDWWTNNQHHVGGYSRTILQGIIRYCRYSRLDLKAITERWLAGNQLDVEQVEKIGLINWQDDLSREEFALEAMRVFGILSKLDHPLIIVFDQLEGLGFPQNRNILSNFGSAVKEIITHVPNSLIILNLFPDRWQQFQQYFDEAVNDRLRQNVINLPSLKQEDFKKILTLKADICGLTLADIFTNQQLEDTVNKSCVRKVLNRASDYFNHKYYGIPLPQNIISKNSIAQRRFTIDLEERVNNLESILTEIAQLVSQFVKKEDTVTTTLIDNTFTIKNEDTLKGNDTKNSLFEYLDKKKQLLKKEYQKPQVITDDDDIGKLKNIIEYLNMMETKIEINQLVLGKRKLPEHLLISRKNINNVIGFLNINSAGFTARLGNFNELVIAHPQYKFTLFRDIREPEITGKVGKLEIEKLNNTKNGEFVIMDEENRLNFELIYNLIIDIQHQDLDINPEEVLRLLPSYFDSYWLTTLL
jgi:DNA polymerase III epsilon subunit-like protein